MVAAKPPHLFRKGTANGCRCLFQVRLQGDIVKVCLYARVSKGDQHPDIQIAELKKYCLLHEHEIVDTFVDYASGATDSRPQLDLMMKNVFQKKYDAIVVWKLDRLGRSLKHLVSVVEQLKSYKVGFISTSQDFDTTKSGGMLLFHIFGAIAQFERELISERTKLGLADAVNVGKRGKDKKPRKKGGYLLRYATPKVRAEWGVAHK